MIYGVENISEINLNMSQDHRLSYLYFLHACKKQLVTLDYSQCIYNQGHNKNIPSLNTPSAMELKCPPPNHLLASKSSLNTQYPTPVAQ